MKSNVAIFTDKTPPSIKGSYPCAQDLKTQTLNPYTFKSKTLLTVTTGFSHVLNACLSFAIP